MADVAIAPTVPLRLRLSRKDLSLKGAENTVFKADFSINLVRDLDVKKGQSLIVALPENRIRVFADS